jgi:hypothetical protein
MWWDGDIIIEAQHATADMLGEASHRFEQAFGALVAFSPEGAS